MTTDLIPAEVSALVRLLPDDFATTINPIDGRRRGRCVEACRIVRAVLGQLGVQTRPMACDVMAANAQAVELINQGLPAQSWGVGAWSIGCCCDSTRPAPISDEPARKRGFGGHLVLVGDGWFVDLTAQQFHRPELGIVVASALVGRWHEDQVAAELDLPRGGLLRWLWRPEIRSYRTVPAWRQDVGSEDTRNLVAAVRARLATDPWR